MLKRFKKTVGGNFSARKVQFILLCCAGFSGTVQIYK